MAATEDHWVAATHAHLSNVGELRHTVLQQLRQTGRDAPDLEKVPKMGGAAVEDGLKRRQRTTQNLNASVSKNMEQIQYSIFQVRQCIAELGKRVHHIQVALSVVDMRLDLRSKRPTSEHVQDAFQDALQQEQNILLESLHENTEKLKAGTNVLLPLEEAKAEMHANRLTVHLDRTGITQRILDRIAECEKSSEQYCRETSKLLEETERRTRKALAKTCSAMKQRIAATVDMKEKIEKEMQLTRLTIAEVELRMQRMHRELVITRNMPERQMNNAQGDFCNKKLSAKTGALAELRAKIKAAAYTGTGGRRLDVLFCRFDRDATGMLDEDEVRKALRTVCRISPQVVSDAEISSLCRLLDEDNSGTVSTSEIIDFLCADVDLDELEQQITFAKSALESLKAAQDQSQIDLRNKVAAWKIDLDCSRVNTVKSLKLDTLPSRPTGRPATSAPQSFTRTAHMFLPTSARSTLGTPRSVGWSPRTPKALPSLTDGPKSLDPATVEALRARIKAAAFVGTSGKQLEVLFKKVDKDGSGQLGPKEVREAMRKVLRIPEKTISDGDIVALCELLDSDRSGCVSVKELVEFVGQDTTTSKRTGKSLNGQTLEPLTNARHGGPPDESAGPPNG